MKARTHSHLTVPAASVARLAERPVIAHLPAPAYPSEVVGVVDMRHALIVACVALGILLGWWFAHPSVTEHPTRASGLNNIVGRSSVRT